MYSLHKQFNAIADDDGGCESGDDDDDDDDDEDEDDDDADDDDVCLSFLPAWSGSLSIIKSQ